MAAGGGRILLRGGRIATMRPGGVAYGLIDDGDVLIEDGRILAVGPDHAIAADGAEIVPLEGRTVTPGLVDCHTHLVFAGDRAGEFEQRLQGVSYAEIAKAGGGILSTVAATRAASEDDLVRLSLPRLNALTAGGATTVEIKSGYGLETDAELRMLRAARRLGQERPVNVVTSFLGAHAVPPEFAGRADDYVDLLCEMTLPAAVEERLANAVDAFCEGIAFSPAQTRRVFEAARRLGLPVKLHAEQLSNLGGAALAASFGALSADHLEYLDEAGVIAMAKAGTVAVLLPGAFYTLRETQMPPVEPLRRHGVPIAVATDLNPGSSPLFSLTLAMNMACTFFRLTPEEALAGCTRVGAMALGLGAEIGTIEPGKRADLVAWDIGHPRELAYAIGHTPPHRRMMEGRWVR
ncbi:MAG: imidazolonepropionase [Geminicoccaceae bacterium]